MQPIYPFRHGDRIRVSVRSYSTSMNILYVRVRYNDGTPDRREILIMHSAGDYSNEVFFSEDPFLQDGYVESLTFDTGLEDREAYIAVFIDNEREGLHYCLSAGYIDPVHIPLGFYEHEQFEHTWVYNAQILRDGSTSGSDVIEISPGDGNEMDLLYGQVSHNEATGRQGRISIENSASDDDVLVHLGDAAINNTYLSFPRENPGASAVRYILTGEQVLKLTLESLAVNIMGKYSVVCRLRGAIPTVVVIKPADSVLTTNTNKVM